MSSHTFDPARFVAATLESVGPCPARADYIELSFATGEGSWDWCFPRPTEETAPTGLQPLVLELGTYGVQAFPVADDGTLGYALLSAEALPMVMAGAEVHIDRRLLRTMAPAAR